MGKGRRLSTAIKGRLKRVCAPQNSVGYIAGEQWIFTMFSNRDFPEGPRKLSTPNTIGLVSIQCVRVSKVRPEHRRSTWITTVVRLDSLDSFVTNSVRVSKTTSLSTSINDTSCCLSNFRRTRVHEEFAFWRKS